MLSQYFSHIAKEAALDPTDYSVLELTKEIARRAGYKRVFTGKVTKSGVPIYANTYTNTKKVTLDNGKVKDAVIWDSVLSAKWYMKFKGYLVTNLMKHPNLEYYYSYILYNVFSSTFSALDIDKLQYDGEVIKYVKQTFCSRLGIAIWEHGSEYKVKQQSLTDAVINGEMSLADAVSQGLDVNNKSYKTWITTGKKAKHPLCRMTAANDRNESIEYLNETVNFQVEDTFGDYRTNSLVLSIKEAIGNDRVGLKLLDGLLNSNITSRFSLKTVGDFVDFTEEELDDKHIEQTKKSLVRAYEIIANTLVDSLDYDGADTSSYDLNSLETKKANFKFNPAKTNKTTSMIDAARRRNILLKQQEEQKHQEQQQQQVEEEAVAMSM